MSVGNEFSLAKQKMQLFIRSTSARIPVMAAALIRR